MDGYNSRFQENYEEETISLCNFSLNSDEQDSDEEETISLRDFYLYSDEHDRHETKELRRCQDLPSQPEKTEFFEFSSNYNSTMSHAEDIINCGKLIPFKGQNHSVSSIDDRASQALYSRRCSSESSTESKRGRMKMRTSKSVDFQKLSRNSIMSSDSHGSSRFDGGSIKIPKPKWYILMFGNVKLPHEMDLQDIKNRQVQRTPSTLFPAALKVAPTNRKSSWGVLNVLSCRDDVSVHVAGSLACMPRV